MFDYLSDLDDIRLDGNPVYDAILKSLLRFKHSLFVLSLGETKIYDVSEVKKFTRLTKLFLPKNKLS